MNLLLVYVYSYCLLLLLYGRSVASFPVQPKGRATTRSVGRIIHPTPRLLLLASPSLAVDDPNKISGNMSNFKVGDTRPLGFLDKIKDTMRPPNNKKFTAFSSKQAEYAFKSRFSKLLMIKLLITVTSIIGFEVEPRLVLLLWRKSPKSFKRLIETTFYVPGVYLLSMGFNNDWVITILHRSKTVKWTWALLVQLFHLSSLIAETVQER